MDENLYIGLLGPVQIALNEKPLKGFESKKAHALFCYLVYINQPVSRSYLANLFWSSKSDSSGLANLSRVLHNNKKLLPGYLNVEYKTVQFTRNTNCIVDIHVFSELLLKGDGDSLMKAISLVRGDFFENVFLTESQEFENWLVREKEAWRQKIARAYNELISIFIEKGNYTEGIEYASRLLTLDPWREETHRRLMLLYSLNGQRLAAVQQFKICCHNLAEELEVEPSQETKSLYEKILHKENDVLANHSVPLMIPNTAVQDTQFVTLPYVPNMESSDLEKILFRLDNIVCRMLTLIDGKQSTGKEQLTFHVASTASRNYRDGMTHFTMSQDKSLETLLTDMVKHFHISVLNHEQLPEQIFHFLRDKEMLLVITNVERHEKFINFLEGLLKRSPYVKVLLTAPVPLESYFEWIYEISDNPIADDLH